MKNVGLFLGLGLFWAILGLGQSAIDNPLLTCLTNPCVQVDGVGKILGTIKVITILKTENGTRHNDIPKILG